MYIYIRTPRYAYMYIYVHVYIHIYIHTYTYTYMSIRMCIWTCIHTCMYTHLHLSLYAGFPSGWTQGSRRSTRYRRGRWDGGVCACVFILYIDVYMFIKKKHIGAGGNDGMAVTRAAAEAAVHQGRRYLRGITPRVLAITRLECLR